jgi:hypothetical protein
MPSEPPVPQQIALPLEFHTPDSVITRLANQMTTQVAAGGVYLSFYEAMVPILLGDPDEVKHRLQAMKSIRAECIARVFIPAERFAEIANAIQAIQNALASLTGAPEAESEGASS